MCLSTFFQVFFFFFCRRRPVALYLIEMGADVTIQAKNGCTAFDMASLIGLLNFDLRSLVLYLHKHLNILYAFVN